MNFTGGKEKEKLSMSENSKTRLKVNSEVLYEVAEDGEEIDAQEAVCLSLTDSARDQVIGAVQG